MKILKYIPIAFLLIKLFDMKVQLVHVNIILYWRFVSFLYGLSSEPV